MNIIRGKQPSAKKVVLYGPEGIGKSTFASQFPNPLFVDVEGSTKELDVARFDSVESWEAILDAVKYVIANPTCCKTLVIDTADWTERLEIVSLCQRNKWASIETPGYGRGYQYLGEDFGTLLSLLDKVILSGIHVVVTAHAKMRKFEQPDEMGAYDRWEMKLSKQVAPLLKEWCDILLFCNYKTFVVQGENAMTKAKVQGGKRVMYTSHHPCWDAKNRCGLQDVLDLDFANISHLFDGAAAAAPSPVETVLQLMDEDGITEGELVAFIASKGNHTSVTRVKSYPEKFLTGWVIKYWKQIVESIEALREQQM